MGDNHQTRKGTGLTGLIIRLDQMDDEELRAADAARAAKWFKVSEAHAEGYIRMARQQRGIG